MSRNLQGCWTCRIRRKGDCEGPGGGGDCEVCVRLNIECLRGYGERLPVEYRRPEIVEPLSRWNRTRAGRAGGERFSITKLHNELMARERSTEASSSSASTASYSSARRGSSSRQSSQAPTVYSDEDRPRRPRVNHMLSDSTLNAELSGSRGQDGSPIPDYASTYLLHASGARELMRPHNVAQVQSESYYDQPRYQTSPRAGESSNIQASTPRTVYSSRQPDPGTSQHGQINNHSGGNRTGQDSGPHPQMVAERSNFEPSFDPEAGYPQWECDGYVVPSNAPPFSPQSYNPVTHQPCGAQGATSDVGPSVGYTPQLAPPPAPFQTMSTSEPWQGSHHQSGVEVDNSFVRSTSYPSGEPYTPETGTETGTGSQLYSIIASNPMVPPRSSAIGAAYPFAQGLPRGPIVVSNPQWFYNLPEQCQQYCPERDGPSYNR